MTAKYTDERSGRYLLTMLLALFVGFGALAAFNFVFDPYDTFFPDSPQEGLWQYRDRLPRRNTASLNQGGQYDAMIMGSSRARFGYDPNHETWEGYRPMNAGMAGTTVYEQERILLHALENQPELRRVLYLPDFFTYNNFSKAPMQMDYEQSLFYPDLNLGEYYLKALFGMDSTVHAGRMFRRWWYNLEIGANDQGFHVGRPRDYYREAVRLGVHAYLFFRQFYGGWEYPVDRMEHFESIIQICRENDIELFIAIPPIHATQMESIWQIGLWDEFERWKWELMQIVNESNEAHPEGQKIPIWDFTGYSKFTTERVPRVWWSRHVMHYFRDSNHSSILTGRFVMSRIFDYANEDVRYDPEWGFRMEDPDEMLQHLLDIRAARRAYHQLDPWEVGWVRMMVEDVTDEKFYNPGGQTGVAGARGVFPMGIVE